MNKNYNIAIIGAGPGGYIAALRAAQMGASVVLFEKGQLGGACLNVGCIPSKALLASAELVHQVHRAAELGIELSGAVSVNWGKMQGRKDKIIQQLRAGVGGLLEARGVTLQRGTAILDRRGQIRLSDSGEATKEFTAEKVVVAVGSVPARVPGWPTDSNVVCTSDEALHWKTLPKRLLIVGGGVIGCEFACMFNALGVKVTIVEMLSQLLPNIEGDVARSLAKIFRARGIEILTGARIDNLASDGQFATAQLKDGAAIVADRALIAVGRRPNTGQIGLDNVGIATENGFIRVNDKMESSLPGYYCIGDANGRCLLAHAASRQGVVAVENALGKESEFASPVPNCIYTFPEVASIGLSTEECIARQLPITTGTFSRANLGKALAVNDSDGFTRIVRHRETDAVLGVHMIGHNVTECIGAAGALLNQRARASDVSEMIFAHPTISETLRDAAEDSMSAALHLPPRKMVRLPAAV